MKYLPCSNFSFLIREEDEPNFKILAQSLLNYIWHPHALSRTHTRLTRPAKPSSRAPVPSNYQKSLFKFTQKLKVIMIIDTCFVWFSKKLILGQATTFQFITFHFSVLACTPFITPQPYHRPHPKACDPFGNHIMYITRIHFRNGLSPKVSL